MIGNYLKDNATNKQPLISFSFSGVVISQTDGNKVRISNVSRSFKPDYGI